MGFKATNRRSPPGQEAPPDFEQREKSSAVGHGVLEESISHDYSTSAHGPDAWSADPLDLWEGRLVGRFGVRPRRAAGLGRLSSRADGADLGWPLRLGARFWADARVHRPHDCE